MGDSSERTTVTCPAWCGRSHGEVTGEDDLVHLSEGRFVRGTFVRLCATVDPVTGVQDGPYVLVGESEYTVTQAGELVGALTEALAAARAVTLRAGAGTRSPGP